jgi:spore coat polysaccharide biosynthesis protein SpsF
MQKMGNKKQIQVEMRRPHGNKPLGFNIRKSEAELTAIVLQARIDSTRLPGKALLPLDGKPLILRVMEALNHIPSDVRILACAEDSLSPFAPLAAEADFEIFAGPKDDVLERYCLVIRKYSIKRVIRATGDNPFVFADAAASLNKEASSLNVDYAGYTNLPYGAGVESVSALALLRAANEAALPSEREHVCPYLYNHPELFSVHRPAARSCWHYPDIRLTVDTHEDYNHAIELYSALKNEPEKYNGETIIKKYAELFSK